MGHIIEPNERILLKCNMNKNEESLYVLETSKGLGITDGYTVDYPISYGFNNKGEYLGTGYDGTFFYSDTWLKFQDVILDTVKEYYTNKGA